MLSRSKECFGDLLARQPERLVITGYRGCMAGYDFCDVACWEAAWSTYIGEIGPPAARCLMGELQYWVRSIRLGAERSLCYFPQGCRHLCHDECMALSVLSAAQREDAAAGCLAVRHLTGAGDPRVIDRLWADSASFAQALKRSGQPLYPVTAAVVESIARMQLLASANMTKIN